MLHCDIRVSVLIGVLMAFSNTSMAQEWGQLHGRFVYAGEIPPAVPLEIRRDEDVCGVHNLKDESLIVNPQNRGVQNIVVWLYSRDSVPVHPKYDDESRRAVMDNKDCRFVPRIVPVRTGQILAVSNSDPIPHNVAVYGRRNSPFSELVPNQRPLEKTFQREELLPIRVDCSIHSWMRAYLMITDHPYVAVSDKDGKFTIPDLPYGDWEFRFWHERTGYLPSFVQNGKDIELSKGIWQVSIDNPEISLGELTVSNLIED